jgi:hypothetical protein
MSTVSLFSVINAEVFESHLVHMKIMLSLTFHVKNAFTTTKPPSKLICSSYTQDLNSSDDRCM